MTTATMTTSATAPGTATIPHSHSSPATMEAGCDNSDSPDSELKKSGKLLSVYILMLDDSTATFHIQHKALGQVLFDQVCKQLNLLESDYFGLEYVDSTGMKYWLDHEKPMNRQLGLNLIKPVLKFAVKFYTPDPAQLEEEYTRYLFCLQIKQDLAVGILQCNDNTAALMASYIVQAECGDYVAEDYPNHTYLSSYKFVPHQDEEIERRTMDNHKKHVGQSPAEADLNLLETARRCELYGIKMHSAKDHEGVPLNLAVAHMGVLVFQNFTKINTFSWAKIRKLSFKRKRFLLKLHPEGYAPSNTETGTASQGYYKDTVEFFFESRNECKNFWKKCVEHHGFFRCAAVKKLPRQKTRVLSRGSSFRYSGRTQKQIVEYVRDNYVKRQPFQRSQSFRHSSSAHSGMRGGMGQSVSAQPLLPLGDGLIHAPVSQSCGSMVLSDESSPSSLDRKDLSVVDGEKSKTLVANGAVCDNEDDGGRMVRANSLDEESRNRPQEERTTLTGSHSTLTHDSISLSQEAPETRANDNDDNVSHDSYLIDDQFSQSPEKPGRKPFGEGMENGVDKMQWNESVAKGIEMMKENVMNGISYVLHRRHYDAELQGSNPTTLRQEITKADSLKLTRTSPARVVVELDHHKKNMQTSPTLYARSRFVSPPSSLTSPTDNLPAKTSKVVDFVSVHSLPASSSFSSQDDSTGMGSFEQEFFDHLSQRKQLLSGDEKDSQMSTESTELSDDDQTAKLLDEDFLKPNVGTTPADTNAEEELTVASQQKAQISIRTLTEPTCDSPVEETWSYAKFGDKEMAKVKPTEEDNVKHLEDTDAEMVQSIDLLGSFDEPLQIVEDEGGTKELSSCSDGFHDAEEMEVVNNEDVSGKAQVDELISEEATPFGEEGKNFGGHVVPDEVIRIIDAMQQEDDLDDDDDDDDEYVRSGFMFPIRTLSRISERSTSDSKTSSPSESHSKRSDEQNPSIADLPSDLSSSDDNPPPSFESDLSSTLYQNQIVLPCEDDEDSKMIETTYYLEINSEQKEQLERIQLEGGPIYKQEYNLTEGEDTSSADNSTLCEDILDDIEEQTEAMCSDVETYEGLGVRIHVSPNKSPSPVKTPDQYEVSMGIVAPKQRHRSTLQLQVANGQIFEDSQSSTTSPDDDDPTAFFGYCSRDET